MASRHTKYHNQQVLRAGMEMFLAKSGEQVIMKALRKTKDSIMAEVQRMIASGEIPEFTGNLINSIGIGIYKKTKLVSYTPIRTETNPPHKQSAGAAASGGLGIPLFGIVGSELLDSTRREEGAHQSYDSYNIVLFAAVPYASYVNEVGAAPQGMGGHPGAWKGGSGGRGLRFFSTLAQKLYLALGRNVFKGNTNFIIDSYVPF